MVKKKSRGVLQRIDIDLSKEIENYAEKEGLSFREASRDLAKKLKITKSKLSKLKI